MTKSQPFWTTTYPPPLVNVVCEWPLIRYTCSCNLPGSLGYEEIDVQMLLDFEIDYFKYDNCYPKLDGSTECLGIPQIKTNNCEDGCNGYVDLVSSLTHFPSIWQDPSEESR